MGKQISFFMTQADEKDFLDAIRRFGPIKVLRNNFADESKMEVQSPPPVVASPDDANLSLLNPTVVTAPKYEYYPSQAYHHIYLAESEVVQWSRCERVSTWLANGRLWFDENCSNGKKSPEFIKWANALLRWIRKNYQRNAVGGYVAPRALELAKAGKLQLGPPHEPSLSLEERRRILGLQ
jgi:hypothetical protein